MYAKEFESAGISKDRFCINIKIPSTGPALSVCPILQVEGIQTLATALGGVPKPQYPGHQNTVVTPKRLQYLASIDPLVAAWHGELASTDVDYLANNGANLESAIKADPIATARLSDALQLFIKVENDSKTLIEKAIQEVD